MRIRFWGTRGSLAKPGPATVRYGGNTSCVEVRGADSTLIVLDCGTGAHDLGQSLQAPGGHSRSGHLLITHTHWDHIQGFPFFAPLFASGNVWDVYAPEGVGQRLEATLAGQMEYSYFPVTLGQLVATIRYHGLVEGVFGLGQVRVTTRYLNHPGLTLGYRLEAGGATVVYATDHEPHSRHHGETGGTGGRAAQPVSVHAEDQRHVEFLAGADLVIHDAQYTLAEYPAKMSWGHTPAELAVDFARAAGARRLALFHHDPLRDDDAMDRLVETCRRRGGGTLDVFGAAEGMVMDVGPGGAAPRVTGPSEAPAAGGRGAAEAAATILLVDDDRDIVDLLVSTLQPEGFALLTACDGEEALRIARAQRPDLILLDLNMPRLDGLGVCRALRGDPDPRLREVPVVLITASTDSSATVAGFAAGATDFVTKPFKPTHIRSRVHTWLLRTLRESAGSP
ncbi:MAG: response regulator [Candidatus Rokubacteria bacterium]|nr:response regulator [Candidatus Rokubacteria bacterium]